MIQSHNVPVPRACGMFTSPFLGEPDSAIIARRYILPFLKSICATIQVEHVFCVRAVPPGL